MDVEDDDRPKEMETEDDDGPKELQNEEMETESKESSDPTGKELKVVELPVLKPDLMAVDIVKVD